MLQAISGRAPSSGFWLVSSLLSFGLARSAATSTFSRSGEWQDNLAAGDPLDLEGRRYLVCARGESNWVRNARAAGEVVVARAMRRHRDAVRELPPCISPPVLKAYLDCFASEMHAIAFQLYFHLES